MTFHFDDPIWKNYINIISNSESIKCESGFIIVNDSYKITPPKLVNFSERINELRWNRIECYKEYHTLYDNILKESSEAGIAELKKRYLAIVNNINQIEKKISEVRLLQHGVQTQFNTDLERQHAKKQNLISRLNEYRREDRAKNFYQTQKKLEKKFKEIYLLEMSASIDYYIEKLPIIELINDSKSEKNGNVNQTKPVKKYQYITPEEAIEIKESVKKLVRNTFKFKNLEQCLSNRRLTEYWMSRKDILKSINDDKKMKLLMPQGFNSMKRDQLCHAIEEIKKNPNSSL